MSALAKCLVVLGWRCTEMSKMQSGRQLYTPVPWVSHKVMILLKNGISMMVLILILKGLSMIRVF